MFHKGLIPHHFIIGKYCNMYLRLEKSASSKETKSGQGLFQKMVRY
jgi:hypothetical protein